MNIGQEERILKQLDTIAKLLKAVDLSQKRENAKIKKLVNSKLWEKLEKDITDLRRAYHRVHNTLHKIKKLEVSYDKNMGS